MLSYIVRFDEDPVAAFSDETESRIWAEDHYNEQMRLPADKREWKSMDIQMMDIRGDCIWAVDLTDDSAADLASVLQYSYKAKPHTRFRVLTERECLMIRDALEHHAERAETTAVIALRSLVDALPENEQSIDLETVRDAFTQPFQRAKRQRLLGEFIRRNHTVVHCTVLIPEI